MRTAVPAALLALLAALALPACGGPTYEQPDFNDAQIDWYAYEAGLARAKDLGRPAMMVIYAPWCPHCHNYASVFHDPEIVGLAGRFVMILVDRDQRPDLGTEYDLDGDYVPRTLFFAKDGTLDPSLHADRTSYLYVYDELDPKDLARGMKAALTQLDP